MKDNALDFQTCALHGNGAEELPKNAISYPIYTVADFDFEKAFDNQCGHRRGWVRIHRNF
jgi:O-acetylhomoserine/O-acetylserine sulfhydrylase-like pyridoxal-dependent enzyme